MKRFPFSTALKGILLFLIPSIFLFSCDQQVKELKVITFTGCTFLDNLTRQNLEFGSVADSGETGALLVSEGDLLYIMGKEEGNITYLIYDSEFGQNLEIIVDTNDLGLHRINGKAYSLYLADDIEYNEVISRLSSEDLAGLGFLNVISEGNSDVVAAARKIADVNPGVGLSVNNRELFYKILAMFHPASLVLTDIEVDDRINEFIPNLDKVELLTMESDSITSWDFLYNMPKLKTLMIGSWDADMKEQIQIDKITNLETLIVSESDMTSLEALGNATRLSELYLFSCESLTDISRIKDMQDITCLGLVGCDTIINLTALNALPSLRWLSLPIDISQEDFEGLVVHHPLLEGIDMLECIYITDLSPLIQLQGLKALSISAEKIDYDILKQLTGIQLIVINETTFSRDEEEIAALKEALPDAHIVPGGGFCMGSGWILLFLPVLLLALGYRRFTRK